MKGKFLLESFEEYVSLVYVPVNEASSPSMSKEQAFETIAEIIRYQRKRGLQNPKVNSIFKEVFGEETLLKVNKSKGWQWADEAEGIVNGKPGGKNLDEFFKKIIQFDEKLYSADLKGGAGSNDNYIPAVMMGIFYQFCSPEIRQQLAQEFADKASDLGLDKGKILKQIEEKAGQSALVGQAPAILGYVDASEITKKTAAASKPPESYSLLDERSQKTLFLDNSWDLDPTIGKKLRDQLYGILERRKSGGKILDLKIQASASRYRNTGKAEKLSWGQLAHKRALVINGMIREILEELQIPAGDPIRQELNAVSKIDISGSNGDGTSGPNPTGVRIGYYQVATKQTKEQTGSSKFVDKDGNDPAKVFITKIDGFGNTEGEPTVKEIPVLTSKDQYDQYKYVNVYIKSEQIGEPSGQKSDIVITKVPANTLVPEVILSKKSKKGESSSTWKFKLPKFKLRMPLSGGPIEPMRGFCPEF